jgi:uncharacterized membrane protein YgdD (TMEM256/DUF423 family)
MRRAARMGTLFTKRRNREKGSTRRTAHFAGAMLVVMTTAARRSIAVTLVIVGIVMGAIGLVLELNGGPSALHVLTWVGGAVFGYGFVSLIYARRGELK